MPCYFHRPPSLSRIVSITSRHSERAKSTMPDDSLRPRFGAGDAGLRPTSIPTSASCWPMRVAKALEGAEKLGGLKSVAEMGKQKDESALPGNEPVDIQHIITGR